MSKRNLNAEQMAAVSGDGNIFVLAGAGTGKTSVLTHRIVRLMEQGVPLYKIMAVTFTNKAAQEMKSRLQEMTGSSISGGWIGTFHGICHRILRQYWEEAKLPKGFTIISDTDQLALIKRTILNEGADAKDEDPKGIQSFIGKEKDRGVRAKDVIVPPKSFDKTRLKKWYGLYEERCEKEGVVDFAELMLRVFELWRDNKEIREKMQKQFKHILVDEFQDTNTLQYMWLQMLKDGDNNIFAVGDDAQSIYGFRGAMMENVKKFIKEYDATLIKLEQNYRSTKPILDLANKIIGGSEVLIQKNLFTTKQTRDKPKVLGFMSSREEAKSARDSMERAHAAGIKYKEMAVIYRTNALSREFEHEFMRSHVPFKVFGGLRFYERQEIKYALAYLKLLSSPNDDGAFLKIVNTPPRGIGAVAIEELRQQSAVTKLSLFDSIDESVAKPKKSQKTLIEFKRLIKSCCEEVSSVSVSMPQKIKVLLIKSGLSDWYKEQAKDKYKSKEMGERLENLTELIVAAKGFQEEFPSGTVEDFLSIAMLESAIDHPEKDDNEDYVSLMTIHAAKGLEFEKVWVAGLEDGLLPHARSIDEGDTEEERRLFYVAMTRAKSDLTLSLCEKRDSYYAEETRDPSIFLEEVKKSDDMVRYDGSLKIKKALKF